MTIFLLELLAVSLIGFGVFLVSVPIGLIFVGFTVLLFAFAFERGQRKVKK
jgi:hypothetical protein|tara:strand:- start:8989 stop:9141 length:153 start_codon:yes stop_codon:yes gene_type:complete